MITTDEIDVRNLQKHISLAVSELSKLNKFVELNRLRRFNELFKLNKHHVENTQSRCWINMTDDKSQKEMSWSFLMRD